MYSAAACVTGEPWNRYDVFSPISRRVADLPDVWGPNKSFLDRNKGGPGSCVTDDKAAASLSPRPWIIRKCLPRLMQRVFPSCIPGATNTLHRCTRGEAGFVVESCCTDQLFCA